MPDFMRRFCLVVLLLTPAEALRAQQASPQPPAAAGNPTEGQSPAKPLPPGTETPAVVIDGAVAQTLLGKPVRSAKGEDLGRVVDVIVDRNGVVQAAVIDFGGFLGVGVRKIAVDWHVLHFPDSDPFDKLIVDLPREQLRKAPAFKEGEPIVIMGRAAPATAAPPSPSPAPTPSPAVPEKTQKTEQPTPQP